MIWVVWITAACHIILILEWTCADLWLPVPLLCPKVMAGAKAENNIALRSLCKQSHCCCMWREAILRKKKINIWWWDESPMVVITIHEGPRGISEGDWRVLFILSCPLCEASVLCLSQSFFSHNPFSTEIQSSVSGVIWSTSVILLVDILASVCHSPFSTTLGVVTIV